MSDARGSSSEVSCEPTPSVIGVSPGKTVNLHNYEKPETATIPSKFV